MVLAIETGIGGGHDKIIMAMIIIMTKMIVITVVMVMVMVLAEMMMLGPER